MTMTVVTGQKLDLLIITGTAVMTNVHCEECSVLKKVALNLLVLAEVFFQEVKN